MNALKAYGEMLTQFAEQSPNWHIESTEPLTIVRATDNSNLPLAITLFGNKENSNVQAYVNLYTNKEFVDLAQTLLKTMNQEDFSKQDDDSGLSILVDSDGFAVVKSFAQLKADEFASVLEELIETSEVILTKLVKDALNVVKNHQPDDEETETTPQGGSDVYLPAVQAIKKYLEDQNYKFKHDEEKKRFALGFNTEKYRDKDGDSSLQIHIIYADDDLLRVSTPWLYEFDLNKVDYATVASAIAWYQFEYKFLSMSLDPRDGELRISLDIPMFDGRVHPNQIKRLTTFCFQFAEETYEELFQELLKSPDSGKQKLESLINNYREEAENRLWVHKLKDKLEGTTDEQKRMIESILAQSDDHKETRGI